MRKGCIGTAEAARRAGVSQPTIGNWFDKGLIDGYRLPDVSYTGARVAVVKGRRFIDEAKFTAFVKSMQRGPGAGGAK